MEEIHIQEKLPNAADYNRLRVAVGWRPYSEPVIEAALPYSLHCLCALFKGEVIGMARIIGDHGMVYYIQDVIVLPEFQRKGIGTRMMDQIMDFIHAHAPHNAIIGLMAAQGKEAFYNQYGFTTRPTNKLGAGMTIFWERESEQRKNDRIF